MKMESLKKGGTTPVPNELVNNFRKYGFTHSDLGLLISYAYGGIYTFEQIVEILIDMHPNETNTFQIQAVVRKAEKHGLFKLVKLSNGNTQLVYKN